MYFIFYRTLKLDSVATNEFFADSKVLFINYTFVFLIRGLLSRRAFLNSGHEFYKSTLKPATIGTTSGKICLVWGLAAFKRNSIINNPFFRTTFSHYSWTDVHVQDVQGKVVVRTWKPDSETEPSWGAQNQVFNKLTQNFL